MITDQDPRTWFVTLEFHDDAFSRDAVVIDVEHIPGCDLLLGSLARIAPFEANKTPKTTRQTNEHTSPQDDISQHGNTTSDGTDSQASRRTTSRSTKGTSRTNKSSDGDIDGLVDRTKSLVFRVGQLNHDQRKQKPHMQVSLHTSLKTSIFNFANRQRAVVYPAPMESAQASFVELSFKDQYLARSDMWQLVLSELTNRTVFKGQHVSYLNTIKARIKTVYVRGRKVNSAMMTSATVPIFRSESARYVFFIQMSREMWEFDADGSGEIMFNKVINGFLPDLFKRWQRSGVRHLVSIILFSRMEYERGILRHTEDYSHGKRSHPKDSEQRDYRDYYRVVSTDLASGDWIRILYDLKREFKVFLRDTLIVPGSEAYGRLPDKLADVKDLSDIDCVIAGRPTIAAKGNVLEAINLASSQFAQDYIDRDLVRTGISLVIVTAGTGVFDVDYDMLKLTTDTLVGNGFGIDLVALSPMPLHSVPLFRYRTPDAAQEILAKSSYGSLARSSGTPRNVSLQHRESVSPMKGQDARGLGGDSASIGSFAIDTEWSYAMPHWVDVSFWNGDADTSWEDTNSRTVQNRVHSDNAFVSTVRIYELQMMGLMDIEVAPIRLPFLPIDIPSINAKTKSKTLNHRTSEMSRMLNSSNAAAWTPAGSPEKNAATVKTTDARDLVLEWMNAHDESVYRAGTRDSILAQVQGTKVQPQQMLDPRRFDSVPSQPPVSNTSPSTSLRSKTSFSQSRASQQSRGRRESIASTTSTTRDETKSVIDGKTPPAKRSKMNRQISLGLRGIGPAKATASTSLSSASTPERNSAMTEIRTQQQPSKPMGLLTQQLRNSLVRKPSEKSLTDHVSQHRPASRESQLRSNPILIQKDHSEDVSNQDTELAGETVRPGTMLKACEYGSTVKPENKITNVGSARKDSIARRGEKILSPLSATSPWLTMLNPSNPRKDNMSVANQFRRWQHVFPRAIPTTVIKWKSLTAPASLPLTSEYFPSGEELRSDYEEKVHHVQVTHGEIEELSPKHINELMMRLLASRLSSGFQLVVGEDADAYAHELGLRLVDYCDPSTPVSRDALVLLSIGNDYHAISCKGDDELVVKRYLRKPFKDGQKTATTLQYLPRVRTELAETYTKRKFALQNPRSTYNWSLIDEHSAAHRLELSDDSRCWRARFVLIPVDVPKATRGPLAPVAEVSDEEIRLDGIQRLTQMWQRHRYIPSHERRNQASVQHGHKDTNPLSIDYQTRDPSAVVRAQAAGPLDNFLLGADQGLLFAEADLYHTSSFDLLHLAQRLQAKPPKGIPMVDRRWHFKLHHRSFRGDELTTWLLANFKDIESREDAVALGNELMKKGLFTHVSSKHRFRDGNYFYQLASEFRTAPHTDSKGWFGRITDRSVHSTPSVETGQSSPLSDRPTSRTSRQPSDASSGEQTPTKERVLELSRVLLYDVDPRGKSWRPEIIHLHYDRIHNPDNCYHIHLEWMNVTSKLIEDVIHTWATTVDRYGLKLVAIPIAEACKISEVHPFRTPYKIELKYQPPKTPPGHYFDVNSFGAPSREDPLAYHKALLRKWDFVLDYEAASSFDVGVAVTYSWGKPDYQYSQYIHKSGTLLAQITDTGSFLVLSNRQFSIRSSTTVVKDPATERGGGGGGSSTLERRQTRPATSPTPSPSARPADIPIPPSPRPFGFSSALSSLRPSAASATAAATSRTATTTQPSFSESRLNGKPCTSDNLLLALEKFCHDRAALEAFWEEALLGPSANASPRVVPSSSSSAAAEHGGGNANRKASPRVTPTLRGVSAAISAGLGGEGTVGGGGGVGKVVEEEIPSLGLGERGVQGLGAEGRDSGASGGGAGAGQGRGGGLAQLLGRPTSPRDILEGAKRGGYLG